MKLLQYLCSKGMIINSVPGGHIAPLYNAALAKDSDCLMSWRTEYGAGAGALGMIQSSNKPMILLSTAGPGITSMTTFVAQAYSESLPLLAIGCNNYKSDLSNRHGLFHELPDSVGIFKGITYLSKRVFTPEEFMYEVVNIIENIFTRVSKPVYLEVPSEVFEKSFNVDVPSEIGKERHDLQMENRIKELEEDLSNANFPVLYVGYGAQDSEIGKFICKMASKYNAVIITTVKGRGSVPDSFPLSLGTVWDRVRSMDSVAQKADVVVALGTSLGYLNTRRGNFPLPAKTYHVCDDFEIIGKTYGKSVPICCKLSEFFKRLHLDGNEEFVATPENKELAEYCAKIKTEWVDEFKSKVPDVAQLVEDIRSSYNEDTIFSLDLCQEAYWLQRYLDVTQPRKILQSFYFANLGYAFPAAIGAAQESKKDVVCIVGDGGFAYGMTELSTVLRYGIRVKILLFNSESFDSVMQIHKRMYGTSPENYNLQNPYYESVSEAYGLNYYKADRNTLKSLLREAEHSEKSYIIEIKDTPVTMFTDIKWNL